MKKTLLFICSCFCLLALVGCHSVSELTKANEELNGGNYTVYYQTHKNVTYGKKEVSDEKEEYVVKQNGNQYMISSWNDSGDRLDIYSETKQEVVEIFKGNGRYWEFDRVEALENYEQKEFLPVIEINEENFVYEDKIWVGNTELINTLLEDYFNELAQEYDSYKGFIDAEISSVVNTYNVTLEKNHLSKIEFDYQVFVTFVDEKVLTISETIIAEYSDIYSTVLTKPEGVLDLSYALEPTDNYTATVFYSVEQVVEGEGATPGMGAEFLLKQDGNKVLISVGNEKIYVEQNGNKVTSYVYSYGEWFKEDVDISELNMMTTYPEIGYTEEFFECVDGVYYGKTHKMNMALEEYLTELEDQFLDSLGSSFGKKAECNIAISEYLIQVTDNVIDGVLVAMTITITNGEETVTFIQSIALKFSEINNTVVETPNVE